MTSRYLSLAVLTCALPFGLLAQPVFQNMSHLLPATNSGGCVGVVDMNGDGLDDVATLHMSQRFVVYYQNADGSFTPHDYGQVSTANQWGMSIGDLANDGHKDLVSGGSYDGVRQLRISAPGAGTLFSLNNGSMFMQCNNMADIDNDGMADFFACHDDAAPRIWMNDGTGALSFANVIDFTTDPPSDGSGNYGSVWVDFDNDGDLDLYIAKCRQSVSNPNDPRRWNRLFVNDGNGNYTDMAEAYGIQIRAQSWTADFADIDNDGDMDLLVTNHDVPNMLFLNDGQGNFTNVSEGSGVNITGFFLQSKFADFDNDGFVDLILTGGTHRYYRNNGDGTFAAISGVFPANKTMRSLSVGDLNNDGFMDVYAAYGNSYVTPDPNFPDRLWLNTPNENHWLGIRLLGTESNRDGIGARVAIHGPWGVQLRDVRAGESYGIVTTFMAHFGLGQETEVDSVVITWPSGIVDTYYDVQGDQVLQAVEGICIAPLATLSLSADPLVCSGGEPLTITASAGQSYQWSNGATGSSISVSTGGYFSVTVDQGDGCTSTAGVFVVADPDVQPVILVDGPLVFCEGSALELTSSEAQGYLWSTGETAQTIEVTESGEYTVTAQGICADLTSEPITVVVQERPEPPVASGVTIPGPGTAELTAEGEDLLWYDVYAGGTPLGSGNTFITPELEENTSFWVETSEVFGGSSGFGGPEARSNIGGFHTNTDNYLIFEANEAFTIRSVKVYANGTANRTIALVSVNNGNTVVSAPFLIQDGESRVEIGFDVPGPGTYGLRLVGGNPQMWRDGQGSNPPFPFPLANDLGAITSTNITGNNVLQFYYYFYDWEVETPGITCTSERTEVTVTLLSTGVPDDGTGLSEDVWPNPARDVLSISWGAMEGSTLVELLDVTGRVVLQDRLAATQGATSQLSLRGVARGEYVLRMMGTTGQRTHRVVVH